MENQVILIFGGMGMKFTNIFGVSYLVQFLHSYLLNFFFGGGLYESPISKLL
jgi:hypothetical protein